jgi:ribosomal subunit interface protein
MQITVTGRNVDVSEALRTNVEEGLNDLAARHHLNPINVIMTLSKQGYMFQTDVTFHIGRGVTIRAHGEGADAYACFNQALNVLETRLRKYKKRLVDHHKHHDQHVTKESVPYYVLDAEAPEIEKDQELAPAIIAEMPKDIPHLSVGDAVMWMDLSLENTMVFRNNNSGQLNVIYRRADGNIGWVDPR